MMWSAMSVAQRLDHRLRCGRSGALERIGGDQDRLEREARVEGVELELVVGELRAEGALEGLRHAARGLYHGTLEMQNSENRPSES